MHDTTQDETDADGLKRREILAASAAVAVGGFAGFGAGVETAEAATGANTVATRTTPAEEIYTDRLRLVDNDRALSADGDMRYNP